MKTVTVPKPYTGPYINIGITGLTDSKRHHCKITDGYIYKCPQSWGINNFPRFLSLGLSSQIVLKKETHVRADGNRADRRTSFAPGPWTHWACPYPESKWDSGWQLGLFLGLLPSKSSPPFPRPSFISHRPQRVPRTGAWGFATPSCRAIWFALFFVLSLSKG